MYLPENVKNIIVLFIFLPLLSFVCFIFSFPLLIDLFLPNRYQFCFYVLRKSPPIGLLCLMFNNTCLALFECMLWVSLSLQNPVTMSGLISVFVCVREVYPQGSCSQKHSADSRQGSKDLRLRFGTRYHYWCQLCSPGQCECLSFIHSDLLSFPTSSAPLQIGWTKINIGGCKKKFYCYINQTWPI